MRLPSLSRNQKILLVAAAAATTVGVAVAASMAQGGGPPPPPLASLSLAANTTSILSGGQVTFTVTALDSSGNPVPGVVASIFEGGSKIGSFPATGADGRSSQLVTFNLPAGTYQVFAEYP